MEKGPSIFAKYWTSERNEIYHFYAHADEFGYTQITEYSMAATEFAKSESKDIISFTAKDGRIFKYDTETNEFIILSHGGKIITYFPPENGIEYFYGQFSEYGGYWND